MDKKIIKFADTEIEEFKFHQYKIPISLNDIDINEIIVSNEFSFDDKILNILLVTKIIKKLDFYAYSFQKRVYIKDISNEIKKINGELICNKKYLKAEKRFKTKESFQYFYIPVILFDSLFKKDGNYYPKIFLENFIQKFFWRYVINISFWSFGSPS